MRDVNILIQEFEQLSSIRETFDHCEESRQYIRWLCQKTYAAPINTLIDSGEPEKFLTEMMWLASIGAIHPALLRDEQTVMMHQFGSLLLDHLKYLTRNEIANPDTLYIQTASGLFQSADEFQLFLDALVRRGVLERFEKGYRLIPAYEVARRETMG